MISVWPQCHVSKPKLDEKYSQASKELKIKKKKTSKRKCNHLKKCDKVCSLELKWSLVKKFKKVH